MQNLKIIIHETPSFCDCCYNSDDFEMTINDVSVEDEAGYPVVLASLHACLAYVFDIIIEAECPEEKYEWYDWFAEKEYQLESKEFLKMVNKMLLEHDFLFQIEYSESE